MPETNKFSDYESHENYFLKEDALQCVSYDLYFSPMKKYYCGAGCNVCYIQEQLKEMKDQYSNFVPAEITQADTDYWLSIFKHFYVIRTNDDFNYLKKHHPNVFEWYKEHAHHFEFGMTDNSILSNFKILMYELDLKGLADITLSEEFLEKTAKNGKVHNTIKELFGKYRACQVKIIRTSKDFEHPKVIKDLIEYLEEYDLKYTLHHDLRYNNNYRHDLTDAFQEQNCYILSHNNRTYHIQKTTVNLFNDGFYYSFDDASQVGFKPFMTVDKTIPFSTKDFLSTMLADKIVYYQNMVDDLKDSEDPVVMKFVDYFKTAQKFKVNQDYNFIPDFMLHNQYVYYHKLKEVGFRDTNVGLYKPTDGPIIPIIEYK